MPTCKKHPKTELVIRSGKRKQNFVVCPDCKPETAAAPAPAEVPAPAEKKKGDAPETGSGKTRWFDREIFG